MLPPLTLLMLGTVLYGVTTDKPIPIVSDLLRPRGAALPAAQQLPPAATMTPQPNIPAARVEGVTYLRDGARFFNEATCRALFDRLHAYELEPFAAIGRHVPPATFRLAPWSGGTRATDAILRAASQGIQTAVSFASALEEYGGIDKIVMFVTDARVVEGKQFAILGPIPMRRSASSASSAHRAPPASAGAVANEAATFEAELAACEGEGCPAQVVTAALERDGASFDVLEAIAIDLEHYPTIVARLKRRAGALRARSRLNTVLATTPPNATAIASAVTPLRHVGRSTRSKRAANGAAPSEPEIIDAPSSDAPAGE